MSLMNCRFYEEKYPEIDSFVMVNVKQVRVAKRRAGAVALALPLAQPKLREVA